MLACLYEAQVAFGQLQCSVLSQYAEDRHRNSGKRIAQHSLMPVAADPVQNDARDTDIVAVTGIAADQGGHGMGEARAIDDQDHCKSKCCGEIRRRARAVRCTVKEAHHRLHDQHRAVFRRSRRIG